MSTGEPASDTFIGRLFSRIKPGSSYAAFPWKSWDRICTILETMRGRGVRIKRSTNETQWEIDATRGEALDNPHAYYVYVHDPKNDTDVDGLPDVMKADTTATVYCYVPCYSQDETNLNVAAGANGAIMTGKVGDFVSEDWPKGFDSWGWKRLGEIDGDWWIVVGVLRPCVGIDKGMQISNIELVKEATYLRDGSKGVVASGNDWRIVPIAAIANNHCVRLMCGRPWAYRPPARPFECRIFRETEESDLGLYIWLPSYSAPAAWGRYVVINGTPCRRSSEGVQGTGWTRLAYLPAGYDSTRVYVEFEESQPDSGGQTYFLWGIHVVQDSGASGMPDSNQGSEHASWASLNAPHVRIATVTSYYSQGLSRDEFERQTRERLEQNHIGTIVASSIPVRLGGENKVGVLRSTDGNVSINLEEKSLSGTWSVGGLKFNGENLSILRVNIDGTSYQLLGYRPS